MRKSWRQLITTTTATLKNILKQKNKLCDWYKNLELWVIIKSQRGIVLYEVYGGNFFSGLFVKYT